MILQTLNDLYHRKAKDGELAIEGWELKEIPFILVLEEDGTLYDIESTFTDAKKKRASAYLVPQGVKRSSGILANLLWDSPAYVLGYKPDMSEDRLKEAKLAFHQRIVNTFGENPNDTGLKAVLAFLGNDPLSQVETFEEQWKVISETLPFMTFRIMGEDELVCRQVAVMEQINAGTGHATKEELTLKQCLITGELAQVARLHPAIKGLFGAQPAGANIVSFNADAFTSYGKSQGDNAPISVQAADAYTKALNWLLGKDSTQKVQLGDTAVVFWAKKPHPLEETLLLCVNPSKQDDDDPSKRADAISSLYNSPWKGKQVDYTEETPFYVVGLSGNASRISVRFWIDGTVAKIAENVRQYFDDIGLDFYKLKGKPSLWHLLSSLVIGEDLKKVPSTTKGDLLKAIFQGTSYPRSVLQLAVDRIKAEQSDLVRKNLGHHRVALIQAYFHRKSNTGEFKMSINENKNKSFLMGRFFAVIERIQETGSNDNKKNIRERYYKSASTYPSKIFPIIIDNIQPYMSKLEKNPKNSGLFIWFEKLLAELSEGIGDEFPRFLLLEDQGRFALGYYQQRQDFFKKDKEDEKSESSE